MATQKEDGSIMKITQEQKAVIANRMKLATQMLHIHEDREGYEIRKSRERCKTYNREHGTDVAFTMERTKKVRHYKKPQPKGWQKHDQHTVTDTHTEVAILYSEGVAIVRRVKLTTHRTYATDTEEADKIVITRQVELPHGTKASVVKLTDYKDLPDTININGTTQPLHTVMEAVLQTSTNIYEVTQDGTETIYLR